MRGLLHDLALMQPENLHHFRIDGIIFGLT